MMKQVLFLCTGNSCRSQMAEGWVKSILGDSVEGYSAGTNPQPLNQRAVEVMQEVGVVISSYTSKHLDTFKDHHFDLIVTVCNNAVESCPIFHKQTRVIHAPFDDPPHLAIDATCEDEALNHYRRVRDEIREFVKSIPVILGNTSREIAK